MKRYLFIFALVVIACSKPESDNVVKDRSIHGFVQKGQFVRGSHVTAFAMDSDLVATGESFPASISDDRGAFGIQGKTSAPYFELRAEGYYYNEIEGKISSSPLYMEALLKSDDTDANINLMTTAIRPRIKRLIGQGMSYDEAVLKAQQELLEAIGFQGNSGDFDGMDITGTTEGDGMLLAFACMIQCNRSASEVTTLIQDVASDLEVDGKLERNVFDRVWSNVSAVNPIRVIGNLARYYSEKGLSISTVPSFSKYLDSRYDVDFLIVDEGVEPGSVIQDAELLAEPDKIEGGIDVLSNIDFSVEADTPGITVQKTKMLGPAYQISFLIPANTELSGRTVHIIFKDSSGNVLGDRAFVQGGKAHAVDMGVSVYWASNNIGADSSEGKGEFFAWGEVEPKEVYDLPSYKWVYAQELEQEEGGIEIQYVLDKYTADDHRAVLDLDDDVAHLRLGDGWRMPTDEEWTELRENCSWTWTEQNNVVGCLITSRINGNSIFLPHAGYKTGGGHYMGASMYWSSTLVVGDDSEKDYFYAKSILIDKNRFQRMEHGRDIGFLVRPVAEKRGEQ